MGKGSRRGMSNSERATNKPTIVHSLILGSGKRLDVNLEFDQNEWLVHEPVATRYLDGFALNFERLKGRTRTMGGVSFTVACGETSVKIQFDRCETSARLRLGPLLAILLNETKIFAHTRSPKSIDMPSMESLPAVTVRMRNSNPNANSDYRDILGTNSLKLDDGVAQIFPEIYAVHSPYFLSLFFGDFTESRDEVVTIGGVSRKVFRWLSRNFAPSNEDKSPMKLDLKEISDVCRNFHRFLIRNTNGIKNQLIKLIIESNDFTPEDVDLIVELAEIEHALSKDLHYIMDAFLGRFVFVQCLSRFLTDSLRDLSPGLAALVCKRMTTLLASSYLRPKLHFEFEHGVIVVEVPTDVYPDLEKVVDHVRNATCQSNGQWVFFPGTVQIPEPRFLTYFDLPARLCESNGDSWMLLNKLSYLNAVKVGLIVSGGDIFTGQSALKSFRVVS